MTTTYVEPTHTVTLTAHQLGVLVGMVQTIHHFMRSEGNPRPDPVMDGIISALNNATEPTKEGR